MSKMKTKNKYREVIEIPIKHIHPNPEQPRVVFNEKEIDGLAKSIRHHGVIQPLVVEADSSSKHFILIDGERRLRASKKAGKTTVPCILRVTKENESRSKELLEIALVANVQRTNMHPIEEIRAFEKLRKMQTDKRYKSVAGLARKLGKSVSDISAKMVFLKLEPEVQELMLSRRIRSAQTKVAAALVEVKRTLQIKIANKAAEHGLTTTQIVGLCNQCKQASGKSIRKKKNSTGSPAVHRTSYKPNGYDALVQIGQLPPWPFLVAQVKSTCADCPLAHVAGPVTCADCGLVDFMNRIVKDVPNAKTA
jgi:ParB family chromosome partitioning protein